MFGEMYLQGCLEYPGGKLYGGKGIGGLWAGFLGLEESIAYISKSLPEAGIGSGWLGDGALYRGAMAFWGVCSCVVAILRVVGGICGAGSGFRVGWRHAGEL